MPAIATMEWVHPHRKDDGKGSRVHVAGTAEQMLAAVTAYEEAGLEQLICSFVADEKETLVEQMRFFSEAVVSRFL